MEELRDEERYAVRAVKLQNQGGKGAAREVSGE